MSPWKSLVIRNSSTCRRKVIVCPATEQGILFTQARCPALVVLKLPGSDFDGRLRSPEPSFTAMTVPTAFSTCVDSASILSGGRSPSSRDRAFVVLILSQGTGNFVAGAEAFYESNIFCYAIAEAFNTKAKTPIEQNGSEHEKLPLLDDGADDIPPARAGVEFHQHDLLIFPRPATVAHPQMRTERLGPNSAAPSHVTVVH